MRGLKVITIGSGIALFVLMVVFAFYAGKDSGITGQVIMENSPQEAPSFKTYTQAQCEANGKYQTCNDVLVVECGGITHELPYVLQNGTALVEKGWEDPRQE